MYTHDEINLLCIFDTSSRSSLIRDLENEQQILMKEDVDFRILIESTLSKLRWMTDDDYDASRDELFPDWKP